MKIYSLLMDFQLMIPLVLIVVVEQMLYYMLVVILGLMVKFWLIGEIRDYFIQI